MSKTKRESTFEVKEKGVPAWIVFPIVTIALFGAFRLYEAKLADDERRSVVDGRAVILGQISGRLKGDETELWKQIYSFAGGDPESIKQPIFTGSDYRLSSNRPSPVMLDKQSAGALIYAACADFQVPKVEILRSLLNTEWIKTDPRLAILPIYRGDQLTLKQLISWGSPIDGYNAYPIKLRPGDPFSLTEMPGDSPLLAAITAKSYDCFAILLRSGANPYATFRITKARREAMINEGRDSLPQKPALNQANLSLNERIKKFRADSELVPISIKSLVAQLEDQTFAILLERNTKRAFSSELTSSLKPLRISDCVPLPSDTYSINAGVELPASAAAGQAAPMTEEAIWSVATPTLGAQSSR